MAGMKAKQGSRGNALAAPGFRIGITIGSPTGYFPATLTIDRVAQTSLFLYDLFQAMPECAQAFLVHAGEASNLQPELGIDPGHVLKLADCLDAVDILLVVSCFVDPQLLKTFRERGGIVINYKARNGVFDTIESAVSKERDKLAERYVDHDCYDRVWMPYRFLATFGPWTRTLYQVDVAGVPDLWSPRIEAVLPPHIRDAFGYDPQAPGQGAKRQWRVGVMESNDTVTSTFHQAALVCEAAYRRRPKAFKAFYVNNSKQYSNDVHLVSFAGKMLSAKDTRMTFEPRFHAWELLGLHCEALVSHQWGAMNHFLIYEALHGRYPAVHNAPELKDWGYYFEEFEAEEGGRLLVEAYHSHDRNAAAYNGKAAELLAKVHPTSTSSISAFQNLLF